MAKFLGGVYHGGYEVGPKNSYVRIETTGTLYGAPTPSGIGLTIDYGAQGATSFGTIFGGAGETRVAYGFTYVDPGGAGVYAGGQSQFDNFGSVTGGAGAAGVSGATGNYNNPADGAPGGAGITGFGLIVNENQVTGGTGGAGAAGGSGTLGGQGGVGGYGIHAAHGGVYNRNAVYYYNNVPTLISAAIVTGGAGGAGGYGAAGGAGGAGILSSYAGSGDNLSGASFGGQGGRGGFGGATTTGGAGGAGGAGLWARDLNGLVFKGAATGGAGGQGGGNLFATAGAGGAGGTGLIVEYTGEHSYSGVILNGVITAGVGGSGGSGVTGGQGGAGGTGVYLNYGTVQGLQNITGGVGGTGGGSGAGGPPGSYVPGAKGGTGGVGVKILRGAFYNRGYVITGGAGGLGGGFASYAGPGGTGGAGAYVDAKGYGYATASPILDNRHGTIVGGAGGQGGSAYGQGAQGDGVDINGGTVLNETDSVIEGRVGVKGGFGLVVNAGTIIGSVAAAQLTYGTLVAEAGSKFVGAVDGGGTSILDLAEGSGTLTNLGVGVTVTGALALQASNMRGYWVNGLWTVAGTGTLGVGSVLHDTGTLVVAGSLKSFAAIDNDGGYYQNNDQAGTVRVSGYLYNGGDIDGEFGTPGPVRPGAASLEVLAGGVAVNTGNIVGAPSPGSYPFGGTFEGRPGFAGAAVSKGGTLTNSGRITGGEGGLGVGGYGVVPDGPGGAGGAGLVIYGGGVLHNTGTLHGGRGGEGGTGGAGGAGVQLLGGGAFTLSGLMLGGMGSYGGAQTYPGLFDQPGAGGAGIADQGGSAVNYGVAVGGGGGLGYQSANGGTGGLGGSGASVGGMFVNKGTIYGGTGGTGGLGQTLSGTGGLGGFGVSLAAGAWFENDGRVQGGLGGQGGGYSNYYKPTFGGLGGDGGAGVYVGPGGGTVVNTGTILAGSGGAGGFNAYGGTQNGSGAVGLAVQMTGAGQLVNGGPAAANARIYGDVRLQGADTFTDWGSVYGEVSFSDPAGRLILEAGATIFGQVSGGQGTVEFAAGVDATITYLGALSTSIGGNLHAGASGFSHYQVDAGASVTLTNPGSIKAGVTFLNEGHLVTYQVIAGNYGVMLGGVGQAGQRNVNGGAGGTGVGAIAVAAHSQMVNQNTIVGGAGGAGAYGYAHGGDGGQGGYGGLAYGAGLIANLGVITGGAGGAGYTRHGAGGQGGYGVMLVGGSAMNLDTITGGAGGQGGYGFVTGGDGGQGGAGAYVGYGSSLFNYGTISGGLGGAGGAAGKGGAAGAAGAAGYGVILYGGTANNVGTINGYVGVYALGGGDTLTNSGAVIGSSGVAVRLSRATDRVIDAIGGTFGGSLVGGGGAIELTSGNYTLSSLGGAVATFTYLGRFSLTGFGTYQMDVAGTLTLTGAETLLAGRTLIDEGRLVLASGTSLLADPGAVVKLTGAVDNPGQISLDGAGALTDLRVLAPGATLSGGGTISLSGTKARIFGASSATTLTNVDNTIVGQGFLGLASLTLVNDAAGVIDSTGKQGLVISTKGATLTNAGLIEAASGSTLVLVTAGIDQSAGGTLLSAGRIDLEGDLVQGGTLASSGAGVLNVNVAGGELDGTTHSVSVSGVVQVLGGSNLTLEGSILDSGKLNTFGGKLIVGAAGASLTGGGQVNLNDLASNTIVGASGSVTLTNADRIDGAGNIGGGALILVNQAAGSIIGNQSLALTIDTGANAITNAGLIENVGKGGTLVKSAVNNTGTLLALTTGTLTLAGAVTGAGVGQINGGTLYVQQAFAETVTFTGATGVLKLGDSVDYTGQVSGLSKTGSSWLDLADIAFGGTTKATYSGTTASGTLTVTDGTHTAHITLVGDYTASTFKVSSDGHGGTIVKDPTSAAAPLTQAMASFQVGPAPALAGTPAYLLPKVPLVHAHA